MRGRIPLARRGLPPSHIFAMASRDQLTARSGQLHGAAEKKTEEKEVEALAEEFANNESEKQALALKCMPLMIEMAASCKMDRPEVDLGSIGTKECQDGCWTDKMVADRIAADKAANDKAAAD